MAVEECCKRNGMSKHQYTYWNRRVRKKQRPAQEISFTEITPILSNRDTGRKEHVPSSDFQIIFMTSGLSFQTILILKHWYDWWRSFGQYDATYRWWGRPHLSGDGCNEFQQTTKWTGFIGTMDLVPLGTATVVIPSLAPIDAAIYQNSGSLS